MNRSFFKRITTVLLTCVLGVSLCSCSSEEQPLEEGKVKVGFSDSSVEGESYQDVVTRFEKAGFTNIITEAKYDVVAGIFAKEDEVDKVSIDGETSFSSSDVYDADATIRIVYHASISDAPKKETEEPEVSATPEPTPTPTPKPTATPKTQTTSSNSKADKEKLASDINGKIGDGFDVANIYYDEELNAIFVNVSNYGIVDSANSAKYNTTAKQSWDYLIDSMKELNDSIIELAHGRGLDVNVLINVLNDANQDNFILSILNGEVLYDYVME